MTPSARTSSKPAPFSYTCPHLGMLDDTTTTTNFPSEVNHCLHCKPACAPSSQHQSEYCLSQNYSSCPIINQPAPARLPAHARWAHEPAEFKSIFIKSALAVFAAGLLALFFLVGAPARISKLIQAFVPDATREPSQPMFYASRTPTTDTRAPYASPTSFIIDIQIPSAVPFTQIVKLTVTELEMGVFCRSGPDVSFRSVAILETGDVLQALARNTANTYYYVRVPKQIVEDCWVAQSFVMTQGDLTSLPVYTPMPTPWPTRTPTPIPPTPTERERTPTPKPPVSPPTDVPADTAEPPPTQPPPEPTDPVEPTDPITG